MAYLVSQCKKINKIDLIVLISDIIDVEKYFKIKCCITINIFRHACKKNVFFDVLNNLSVDLFKIFIIFENLIFFNIK